MITIEVTERELALINAALEIVRPVGGSSPENNLLAKLPGEIDHTITQKMHRAVIAGFMEMLAETSEDHGITVDVLQLSEELEKAGLM